MWKELRKYNKFSSINYELIHFLNKFMTNENDCIINYFHSLLFYFISLQLNIKVYSKD